MARIVSIETSASICSVAIHERGELLALAEIKELGAHAEKLLDLVDAVLKQADLRLVDLAAIAVSQGPGSYTGLRIGVSTAKGIAYALDIPLIGINTLQAMAASHRVEQGEFVVAVLDARRNEVYTQTFGASLQEISPIEAVVLEEGVFDSILDQGKVYFVGDGVEKVKEEIKSVNALFLEDWEQSLSAKNMGVLAFEKYARQEWEDLAYFVPNYLKEFKALQSTKNPLLKL
ncbi:MAG: tRNA (adenosine(37)-N6)-threonylcarbamoyltransferase complex dimerization subunit type 1 TsaB [Bacteroidetes bacterium]|nr:tRNA (adenosine(37)-N6)-threonylcarbamoyltransferase complex dimerization subunit type 1 TsaB [Bacteroidota bacterium]